MENLGLWIPALLILLHYYCLRASAIGNLTSDAQFLLKFAESIPHGPKLNWSAQVPVCSSWVGVTCTPDGGRVHSLRLPGTGLSGQIPADTLGELDALEILSLHSNRLALDLPSDVPSIPSLSSLFLQRNELSGAVPSSLSSNLTFLDLSCNSFTGEIPPAVQNLTRLTALYLENNSLSGPIPRLRLPKLKHLNLSYNNLTGSIPESLQSFPVESFLGNPFLCGTPLAQCSAKRNFWKTPSTGIIIIVAGGGSCLLLALVTAALICTSRRKSRKRSGTSKGNGAAGRSTDKLEEYSSSVQEAEKNKLVFFEGCSYNFDLEDLLRASAEVLGKGSHGTTYKAVLEDGVAVVVKRLKEVAAGKREFEQQMEIIGSVGKHPNVVQLRSYYYSKDEKLLVFDYAPLGNLSTFLHGGEL